MNILQEDTIIIELFCKIADEIGKKDKKHPQAKLYLSEILLCGILFVLKGSSFDQFYIWLKRRNILNLPESSRLLTNHRWAIGRKVCVCLNKNLEIVKYSDETLNLPDKVFNEELKNLKGIVFTDQGFRDRKGVPENFKICKRGKWNCRMLVETLFSLWSRICGFKKSFHRTVHGFKAKVDYMIALTNLVFGLNEKLGFNKFSMKQWAL